MVEIFQDMSSGHVTLDFRDRERFFTKDWRSLLPLTSSQKLLVRITLSFSCIKHID